MSTQNIPDTKFHALLNEQIRHEFTTTQQYLAIAAYFDSSDLPQLAKFFYDHADEERAHAMKIVKYFIDRDFEVVIPGVGEVRNEFDKPRDALALALEVERTTTRQVGELAAAAREERDLLGEQLMWWFLKEQVEEEALFTTLLNVVERAGANLFDLEAFVAREINS